MKRQQVYDNNDDDNDNVGSVFVLSFNNVQDNNENEEIIDIGVSENENENEKKEENGGNVSRIFRYNGNTVSVLIIPFFFTISIFEYVLNINNFNPFFIIKIRGSRYCGNNPGTNSPNPPYFNA